MGMADNTPGKTWLGLGLALFFVLVPESLVAAGATTPQELLPQAKEAIALFLPAAELVEVDGKRADAGGCAGTINWRFVFQTADPALYDGKAVAGYVAYTGQTLATGDCRENERIVADTAMAPVLGFYNLARHHDLDMVHLSWQEVLKLAQTSYPNFVWAGTLQIYSPLYPVLQNSVYYVLPGQMDGKSLKVFVNATTGEMTAN